MKPEEELQGEDGADSIFPLALLLAEGAYQSFRSPQGERTCIFFPWDNSFLQATRDLTAITCSFCLKPSTRPFCCARAELQQKDEGIGELYSPSLPQPSPSQWSWDPAQHNQTTAWFQMSPWCLIKPGLWVVLPVSFPSGNGGVDESRPQTLLQGRGYHCPALCEIQSRAQPCAELGNLTTPEVNTNAVLDPTGSTANLPSNTARNLPLLKLSFSL